MRTLFDHFPLKLLSIDGLLVIEPWSFPAPPIQGGRVSTARALDTLCPLLHPCKIHISNLLIPRAHTMSTLDEQLKPHSQPPSNSQLRAHAPRARDEQVTCATCVIPIDPSSPNLYSGSPATKRENSIIAIVFKEIPP